MGVGWLVIDSSSLSLSTQTRKMISMWKNVQTRFAFSLNTGIFPLGALDYVSLCFSVFYAWLRGAGGQTQLSVFLKVAGFSEKNMT